MEDAVDDPQGKRREQVRRAQKTHRARKAVYVRSLETELSELREQNAVHVNVIHQLQTLLAANGIPIPGELIHPKDCGPVGAISLSGNKRANQTIVAQLPSADQNHDSQVATSRESSSTAPSQTSITVREAAHPQGLDSTQVAVNFILALEQPCIHHHRMPSPELLVAGSIGSGHKAMLSSPIMARAPSYSFNPLKMGYNPDSQWSVPTTELETLLQSSHKLALDSEVTPIQIWQMLKDSPKFNYITFERLEHLREMLLPSVKCYGFGAVIDQLLLDQVLEQFFPGL